MSVADDVTLGIGKLAPDSGFQLITQANYQVKIAASLQGIFGIDNIRLCKNRIGYETHDLTIKHK